MIAVLLLASCAPEVSLELPVGPVSGEVVLGAEGLVDRLVIDVNGALVDGGPGPALTVTWDSRAVEDGVHLVRAAGYTGGVLVAWAEEELETIQALSQDPLSVRFLLPQDGSSGLDPDRVDIVFDVSAPAPLEEVTVFADGEILAHLPAEGPMELRWENVEEGEHCLDAHVSDERGESASASVCFSVGVEEAASR